MEQVTAMTRTLIEQKMSMVSTLQFNVQKTSNDLEHHKRIWNTKQFEKLTTVLRSSEEIKTVLESLQLKIQDMVNYH